MIQDILKKQQENKIYESTKEWREKQNGDRQCALQGLEIMQVEILSGKELTNPPEVSFELLLVTTVVKRKQRDSRDSY